MRAFIDSYGILAIPFAAFISWATTRKWILKALFGLLLGVLLLFNLFQIAQYRNGAIHYVSMTKKAYWETFGKLKPTNKFYEYLEFPDYKNVEDRIKNKRTQRDQLDEDKNN